MGRRFLWRASWCLRVVVVGDILRHCTGVVSGRPERRAGTQLPDGAKVKPSKEQLVCDLGSQLCIVPIAVTSGAVVVYRNSLSLKSLKLRKAES